jgi:hypothetical protein
MERLRRDVSLNEFEKACILKKGEWVGPPPNGLQKWNLRWRGVREGVVEGCCSDEFQTNIEFSIGEDGRLTLEAVFTYGFKPMALRGVKTGEGKPQRGNDPTVTNRWLLYKPRYI